MRQNRTPLNLPQFEVPALVNTFIFYHTLAKPGHCVLLYTFSNVTLKFCAANVDVDIAVSAVYSYMSSIIFFLQMILILLLSWPFAKRRVPHENSFCKEDGSVGHFPIYKRLLLSI